jgi:exodeoxyribonuclease VII small subunit
LLWYEGGKDMPDDKEIVTLSFETALKELEAIVNKLEKGGINLEDSLQYFEKGIALANLCQQTLKKSEQKVATLIGTDLTSFESEEVEG